MTAQLYSVTTWSLHRGAWRKGKTVSGMSLADAAMYVLELQTPCTHPGPCVFPFKSCDGGTSLSIEKE